ncbi:MAG: DNA repair protein RecO [Gammaproteobacteria bacterium]|nr:DNA repair protein RecO [Gammaproteobacteria bacterium]
MESRVLLQPAYVLHRAPFQNTSLLVDFFMLDYGRVRAVAKGARREKSKYRPLLQPFHPLLVSVSGRGEVKTVASVETGLAAILLQGERLFSGLYVNELLTRLLHNHEEHTVLYKHYQETLIALQGSENIETVLRRFELNLLAELGYAINLEEDFCSHEAIEPDSHYRFTPDMGFELLHSDDANDSPHSFQGRHLVRLREMDLQDRDTAKSAKRLLRMALTAHLGEKSINSRGLFASKH